jgi:hypothetical protein
MESTRDFVRIHRQIRCIQVFFFRFLSEHSSPFFLQNVIVVFQLMSLLWSYSYGTLLWELVTRKMPFEGRDPLEVWAKVREGEREIIPSHVPSRLRNLITSCWSATPLDRPSFSEILEILKEMNADNKRHRSATLQSGDPPSSSSSSLPYGKINLGIGSQTFVVDEPMIYKMNSAIKCHDLSNNDTLLSSLPAYVIPARLVDVTFMNSRAAIGISKYMDMYSAAVLPCVTVLFSIVLREMRGTRMSHVFLYDKATLKVMDENISDTVPKEDVIKTSMSGGDINQEKVEHSNEGPPKFLSVRTILSAFHSDPIPRRKEEQRSADESAVSLFENAFGWKYSSPLFPPQRPSASCDTFCCDTIFLSRFRSSGVPD